MLVSPDPEVGYELADVVVPSFTAMLLAVAKKIMVKSARYVMIDSTVGNGIQPSRH